MEVSIYELLAAARESAKSDYIKGDSILCEKRFHPDTHYMVEIELLKNDNKLGKKGNYIRKFLTEPEYLPILQKQENYMNPWTHEPRYQSARCLMCGCCLEVCPNFSANGTFAGAVAAVNAFRILNEEQESTHLNEISAEYKKKYFEGCGKSLSCHDICPIGLPVEELLVRSNAAAVWGK